MILHGDAMDILEDLPAAAYDALVTDPPAGISFMGKTWDADHGGRDHWIAWLRRIMQECYRVMKPGAHGLVWALPRTSNWTATALEDAGFEIRDRVGHVYGQGFPKSLDVSKAIDKAAGAKRPIIGYREKTESHTKAYAGEDRDDKPWGKAILPATAPAKQWEGWGTALKPAMEDWWLIRKPLSEKNITSNVLKHGTGAINVDGCRVGSESTARIQRGACGFKGDVSGTVETGSASGRFPANLIVSGSARDVMDEQSGIAKPVNRGPSTSGHQDAYVGGKVRKPVPRVDHSSDGGGASRFFADCADYPPFFYVAKPSKRERDAGLAGGVTSDGRNKSIDNPYLRGETVRKNVHPTVKPVKLMRYLCRLVTPPGGTVLDPFAGSGTTGVAATLEGFKFLGIEREAEYVEIARARIEHAQKEAAGQVPLPIAIEETEAVSEPVEDAVPEAQMTLEDFL